MGAMHHAMLRQVDGMNCNRCEAAIPMTHDLTGRVVAAACPVVGRLPAIFDANATPPMRGGSE